MKSDIKTAIIVLIAALWFAIAVYHKHFLPPSPPPFKTVPTDMHSPISTEPPAPIFEDPIINDPNLKTHSKQENTTLVTWGLTDHHRDVLRRGKQYHYKGKLYYLHGGLLHYRVRIDTADVLKPHHRYSCALAVICNPSFEKAILKNPTSTFTVTAYCPCSECCGQWSDGLFANGEPVGGLAIAADRSIPFGTKITVPGYGTAEVKDRGSAITENRLDLYFNDHRTALQWGVRTLKCKVFK